MKPNLSPQNFIGLALNQTNPKELFNPLNSIELFDEHLQSTLLLDGQELCDRLNNMTRALLNGLYFKSEAIKPSQSLKRFTGLRTRTSRLLKRIEEGGKIDPDSKQELYKLIEDAQSAAASIHLWNIPSKVLAIADKKRLFAKSAIKALKLLHAYCHNIAVRMERKVNYNKAEGKTGNPTDQAVQDLFGDLAGLWIDVCGEMPGVSTSVIAKQNIIGGPFVRFVQRYLKELQNSLAEDLVSQSTDLRHTLGMSGETLKKRFYNLKLTKIRKHIAI